MKKIVLLWLIFLSIPVSGQDSVQTVLRAKGPFFNWLPNKEGKFQRIETYQGKFQCENQMHEGLSSIYRWEMGQKKFRLTILSQNFILVIGYDSLQKVTGDSEVIVSGKITVINRLAESIYSFFIESGEIKINRKKGKVRLIDLILKPDESVKV